LNKVEDNSINQLLALKILSRAGFSDVAVANHGLEAIEAISKKVYDVVLMDCSMPVLVFLSPRSRIL
jgi:CheY-like chemotaxis protein